MTLLTFILAGQFEALAERDHLTAATNGLRETVGYAPGSSLSFLTASFGSRRPHAWTSTTNFHNQRTGSVIADATYDADWR